MHDKKVRKTDFTRKYYQGNQILPSQYVLKLRVYTHVHILKLKLMMIITK